MALGLLPATTVFAALTAQTAPPAPAWPLPSQAPPPAPASPSTTQTPAPAWPPPSQTPPPFSASPVTTQAPPPAPASPTTTQTSAPVPVWPVPSPAAPAVATWPATIQTAPAPPKPLGRAGFFEKGINIDLLEIGALQAFGSGGNAAGVALGVGAEIDLDPRAAIRVPLRLGFAGDIATTDTTGSSTSTSFAEVVIAPAFVYRFRYDRHQRWIPFVGGALALGAFQFGRQLLGLAPSPPGVSQSFLKLGAAPEALGGILYSPARLFALRFAASYTYMYVAQTSAHALAETIDVRFMF
jgi:hypothetical protein